MLPALQSQLLPDHSGLCQFPSERVKKYFLTDIPNTVISSKSTSYSVLLISGRDAQVQSEWMNVRTCFVLVTANTKNTWRYQNLGKPFLIAAYFPAL